MDLTWRILSDAVSTSSSQLHAVCGPVLVRQQGKSDQDISVEEFYSIREVQTREASVMKYGEEVKGKCFVLFLICTYARGESTNFQGGGANTF